MLKKNVGFKRNSLKRGCEANKGRENGKKNVIKPEDWVDEALKKTPSGG